ncbi:MAG TPA: universal stress protein [Desulfobulbaceae bacterium]|nr:universal stress protein [Desulfobulbaceae bacterium]
MDIKTILIPIDFSENSFYALEYALDLAANHGSTVRILYVNRDESMLYHYLSTSEYEAIRDRALEDAKAMLKDLENKFPKLKEIDYHYHVRRGVPYVEILEELEKNPVDLVVIGSHGKHASKKYFYGTTAEKVVRRTDTTILVTRKPD